METEKIGVADVWVGDRLRPVNPEQVSDLVKSIQQLGGLRTPITVRIIAEMVGDDGVVTESVPALVAGRHRLEAARQLGWSEIDAIIIGGDERDARLWEIAENLHRAELTVLERSEHVAEWIRLTEEKVAQLGPPSGGHQPAEAGIRKAAREIGVSRQQAQRAAKVDGLSDEAKTAAREVGLADNQSALLKAASLPAAEQAEAIRRYEPARSKPVPLPKNEIETEEDWRVSMMRLWNRAPDEWRERFIDYVQAPVFDTVAAGRN